MRTSLLPTAIAACLILAFNLAVLAGAVYVVVWVLRAMGVVA